MHLETRPVFLPSLFFFFSVFFLHSPFSLAGETVLTANNAVWSGLFGSSVSIDADQAVVGAPRDDIVCNPEIPCILPPPGSAYVFRFNGSAWVEEAVLAAGDAVQGDHFGSSVSIRGDRVIIGSRNDAAYIFRNTPAGWIEEAKLNPPGGGALFTGVTGAIDGDVAVTGGNRTILYRFDGASWIEEAELTSAGFPVPGNAVSIEGETVLAGYESGAAHIFAYNGLAWVEEAVLLPGDGGLGFGGSVSLSGNAAVVGARKADASGTTSGAAYVFRFNGLSWVEEAKLFPADGADGDYFGTSVGMAGDTVVIGANGESSAGTWSGAAYVFQFNGNLWEETAKLVPVDGSMFDRTGTSVATNGGTFLVGSPDKDTLNSNEGSVSVFVLSGDPPVAQADGPSYFKEGQVAYMDAHLSYDPDGDPLSYFWSQVSGPAVLLSDPTRIIVSFTAPVVDRDVVLTFQLTVSDGAFRDSTTHDVPVINTVGPDLFFTRLEAGKTSVRAGGRLGVKNAVQNGGREPAGPSTAGFFFSENAVVGDGDDIPLFPGRNVGPLDVEKSSQENTRLDIPVTVPPGDYFLCGSADLEDAVGESNEGNNDFCSSIPVTVWSGG